MPPRQRSGDHLTEHDLIKLSSALAVGKRATVYLIDATPSLGLPAGCSAKVVSVDGSTVLIRPKGVNDELPFEADELRLTRQTAKAAPAKSVAKASGTPRASSVQEVEARAALSRATAPKPPSTAKPSTPKPATASQPSAAHPKALVTPSRTDTAGASTPAPAKRAPRRSKDPASVSVTLHAEAGNEWTVTVTHGERRPGKAAPVTADAVERAIAELGDTTAREAVASVLSAARDAAAQRVEELSRQLAEARSTLESLGADGA